MITTQRTPSEHPAMSPVPFGLPVPKAVKTASDAYEAATARLAEAQEEHRAAEKRDDHTQRAYDDALANAVNNGVRRSSIQQPHLRSRATGAAYDQAVGNARAAELAFVDAIYEHRPQWVADAEEAQAAARDQVGPLLAQLAVALRDQHALAQLVKVLKVWRYDPELEPDHRLSIVHKRKPQYRPDFPSVTLEATVRNSLRMSHVRLAMERDPDGRIL